MRSGSALRSSSKRRPPPQQLQQLGRQSRSWRRASASCASGRVIPGPTSNRTNCRRRSCSGMSASGTGLKTTGISRLDSSIVLSTSHAQRSDFTASGDMTYTTVSACWIRRLRRSSQGSPGAMSCRSRNGANPATSNPVSYSSAKSLLSHREYEMNTFSLSLEPISAMPKPSLLNCQAQAISFASGL